MCRYLMTNELIFDRMNNLYNPSETNYYVLSENYILASLSVMCLAI